MDEWSQSSPVIACIEGAVKPQDLWWLQLLLNMWFDTFFRCPWATSIGSGETWCSSPNPSLLHPSSFHVLSGLDNWWINLFERQILCYFFEFLHLNIRSNNYIKVEQINTLFFFNRHYVTLLLQRQLVNFIPFSELRATTCTE